MEVSWSRSLGHRPWRLETLNCFFLQPSVTCAKWPWGFVVYVYYQKFENVSWECHGWMNGVIGCIWGVLAKARNKMEEGDQPTILLLFFLLLSFSFHIFLFRFDGERELLHMCVPFIHPTSKPKIICSSGVLIFNWFGTTISLEDPNLVQLMPSSHKSTTNP